MRDRAFVIAGTLVSMAAGTMLWAFGQQVPVRPAAPAPAQGRGAGAGQLAPPKGTGLIVGQVVDGSSGRPVGGAIVSMSGSAVVEAPAAAPGGVAGAAPTSGGAGGRGAGAGAGGGASDPTAAALQARMAALASQGLMTPQAMNVAGGMQAIAQVRVMTDGDGRFMFHDLPKGSFSLSASSPGYTNGGYLQRTPTGPTRQLDLDTGQRLGDVTLRIWKLTSITGTVVDEFGDPLVNVNVRAMRRTVVNGQKRVTGSSSTQTDDRGIYRFGSLTPGEYIVGVPTGTTSLPTSMVDEYQRAMAALSAGPGPDQQAAQQQFNKWIETLTMANAPTPSGNGYKIGNAQLQPNGALGRMTPPPAETGRLMVYQTTFFPGTPAASQAQAITLASADERSGVDFQMRLVPTAAISGTLNGPDGPTSNVGVKLIPIDARDFSSTNGYETASSATGALGEFTFLGVPAGQYLIRAQKFPRPQNGPVVSVNVGTQQTITLNGRAASAAPPAPVEPTLWAEMPVSVTTADVNGLEVNFRQGLRVSGRIEFDGASPRPAPERLQQVTITLSPVDPGSNGQYQPTRLRQDGQFTSMEYLPGRYWTTASSPGGGWTLKSITANGRDVMQYPLTLDSSDLNGLTITYTDKPTQLSGAVQTSTGAAEPYAMVVAFPMGYQAWIDNGMSTRATRQARTGKAGTYQLSLPPGDYLVVAMSDELANDWQDPATVQALVRSASRLSIGDGEKKTLDLRLSQVK